MILLVASKVDKAAVNIADQLLKNHGFDETSETFDGNPVYSKNLRNEEAANLVFIEQESVGTQSLGFPSSLRLLIFLSRHKSKSGTPTLSVHTPGNLGEAALGGLPRRVSVSPASAMKEALKAMKTAQEELGLEYEVSYECTHHGPSLDVPTMFVELGSSPKQWEDVDAAEAVARGAMAAAVNKKVYPAVLGIGGPHYSRKFTKKALSTETAFGHIIPKYAIGEIDAEILRQCVTRTVEPVEKVVLDWKGIRGADKEILLNFLGEIDIEIERI
jgi:D-aminoacyl-tRNA deacylase